MDLARLASPSPSKIVLAVVDGLGGLADAEHGTELEDADTPNLDRLAFEGATGLLEPVGPGITPGSGPGHLALFGYDPMEYELGRGTLSAAGLEFDLLAGDVAARGNLCTLDRDGLVVDRRAGRIPNEEGRRVVRRLEEAVRLEGAEVLFRHERDHRVLVVLRGEGLDPRVGDTDPQATGVPARPARPLVPAAGRTAELVGAVTEAARRALAEEPRANGLLLRGFDSQRELPSFADRYGVRAAAAAVYPMYRGVARLLGMRVLGAPGGLEEQVDLVRRHWEEADYFFFHFKDADAAGEDGDRAAKIAALERFDAAVPGLAGLGADVLAVTGDHATPSQLAAHSWHPVPVLVRGRWVGRDDVDRFGERWCRLGGLGLRPSTSLMPLLLANARRIAKYGA